MDIIWSDIEGEVLVDGIGVELAFDGDGMNVGGWWIDTEIYNPDDLDEIRRVILTDPDVQLRLSRLIAARDYARSLRRRSQ